MKIKTDLPFYLFRILISLTLLLTTYPGLCQKDFSVTNYTTKNGLAENNVQSVVMDDDGFLWLSYGNGLLRFDGHSFRKFFTSSTPYIIFNIFKTLDNEMIIVDASGAIFSIKNGKHDTLRTGNVNSLNYFSVKGTLPDRSFYFRTTTPHINKALDRNWFSEPVYVFPLDDNSHAVRTKKGIALYRDSVFEKELNLESLSPADFIAVDNGIYFFSDQNKMYYIDIAAWKAVPCELKGAIHDDNTFSSSSISTHWNYNNSASCVLSGYRLYHLTTEKENPLKINSELITDKIPSNCLITGVVYKPEKHLLIIGSDTKGLFVFREKMFRTLAYQNPEAGTNNAYYCQLELDSNTIFTDWNREFTIHGGKKSRLSLDRNYSENIFRDSKGFLWFQQERRLVRYNPQTGTYHTIANPDRQFVLSYFEEGDSIWAGTFNSLACIVRDTLRVVQRLHNNGSNSNIFQLFRWKDNKIWFCNYTGVFSYDAKEKRIDTLQLLYEKYPYNISFYKEFMMIGTYGRGYYFYRDGKAIQMPVDANNQLRQVHAFVNDSFGNTWLATNNGILKTRFSQLEEYFNDTLSAVYFIHYDEEDGIESAEMNGGCEPSAITLKNGYVSFPASEGLIWFKPENVFDAAMTTPVLIDAIYFDEVAVHNDSVINVPAGVQSVRIDFTTSYWGNAENLVLEYRLEGYNRQWITIGSEEKHVEFSNLRSGDYIFFIRKKSGYQPGDYLVRRIAVSVEKKYYEKPWFILLCLAASVFIVIVIARIYAYNIKQKNIALEASVMQRTKELSLANEALQQSVKVKDRLISIISHDIVTPLRFITMVAAKGADKKNQILQENLPDVLKEIKNTSEKLHGNAQNILNWIKHQNNRFIVNKSNVAIGALADEIAEQFREIAASKEITIINQIPPDDIYKTDRNILSVILHNLISNATKFTSNGTISLSAFQDEQHYHIVVEDTGTGMQEAQVNRLRNTLNRQPDNSQLSTGEQGHGLGYVIIGELSGLINASITVESEKNKGTKISLIL